MQASKLPISALAISLILLAFILSGSECVRGFTSALLPKDHDRAAQLRQAGIRGDVSQVPALIDALKENHPVFKKTALHALAQIGAADALPAIDAALQNTVDQDIINFARVEKARLIAENGASNIADTRGQAVARVNLFYQNLGLTSATLNAAVTAYQSKTGNEHISVPVEVYAMREFADIIYHGSYKDYVSMPEVATINFSLDPASALKMRLAPLSQKDRIAMLIHDLANNQVLPTLDNYEMQLAIDEDSAASHAIAVELHQMDAKPDRNKGMGYAALFRVLGGIGDKEQAGLIENYLHDPDGDIGYFARQVYYDLKDGLKRQYAAGY